jgi:hypothetical protein
LTLALVVLLKCAQLAVVGLEVFRSVAVPIAIAIAIAFVIVIVVVLVGLCTRPS